MTKIRKTPINYKLRDHVTSMAFSLHLSKRMILCLVDIAEKRYLERKFYQALGLNDYFIGSYRNLEERGLVTYKDPGPMTAMSKEHPYSLTRAGELVLELLKEAGMVQEINQTHKELTA